MTDEHRPVACVGEAMAMVTTSGGESLAEGAAFTITPGGAEANVASHLAALGVDTRLLGRLGDDALGDRVARTLGERGVDLRWLTRDADAPTGVYFKDPSPGARPTMSYYRSLSAASRTSVVDLDGWPMADVGWVHTTGITAALSDACAHLVERLVEGATPPDRAGPGHAGTVAPAGYGVSFDVNYRPALWPSRETAARRCLELGRRCHVVFVGLDEARNLWDVDTADDVARLFDTVPCVVVKNGGEDAVEIVPGRSGSRGVTRAAAESAEVLEAVGAGDAFAAGFLAQYLRGGSSEQRLAAGHALAAWTIGSVDDFRAAPHGMWAG